ncbi:hypothetical protein CRUP_021519 [Coryphaenoides rupestris]|nr:hypothetical protein CRUP_021519 [Coryphaenoides rupestris]
MTFATPARLRARVFAERAKPPPYDADLPEPCNRADLMKHWLTLSLDDKTAQKLLWISENGTKVARTSDAVCPYPNRPDRYDHAPQEVPPSPRPHEPVFSAQAHEPLWLLRAGAPPAPERRRSPQGPVRKSTSSSHGNSAALPCTGR